jgi:WD40 repeat protein
MLFNKDNFLPPFYVFDTKFNIVEPSDDKVSGGLCGAYFTEDGSIISAWNDANKTAVIRIYSINDNKLVKSAEYPFGDEKIFGFSSYEENKRVKDKKLLGFFSSPDRKFVAVLRNEYAGGDPRDPIHCIVYVWNVKTPNNIVSFSIEDINHEIKSFEFNPTNNKIIAIGFKGYISIYNITSLTNARGGSIRSIKLYHTVDKVEGLIYSVAWSPDGNTIAFCNEEPIVCLYQLKGEYWVKDDEIEITSTIKQICFDLTGKLLVATDTNILIGTKQSEFDQPSPICEMIRDVYKNEDFEKIKGLCDIMLREPLDVILAALQKAQAEYRPPDAKGGTRRYKKMSKTVK